MTHLGLRYTTTLSPLFGVGFKFCEVITIGKSIKDTDLKEYVGSILSMQESNGAELIKRSVLVDLTKEWRKWIIDNNALFYASVPRLKYGFVCAQKEEFDDEGHLVGIVGIMVPEEKGTTISNYDANISWVPAVYPIRHCYLTRQLIRMYKRFIGLQNKIDKERRDEIALSAKKVEIWLGDTSFLDLP